MDIKDTLDNFYSDIIYNHWEFLNNTCRSNINKQYHRNKISNYENIKIVKENIYNIYIWIITCIYFN